MSEPADITAIVLDVDGRSVSDCLQSLLAQTSPFARVVVVDNGSDVPVHSRVSPAIADRLTVIRLERNEGFTGGANRAFATVTTSFVALINNDVVLSPEWVATCVAAMSEEKVAATQAILLSNDGTIDGAGVELMAGRVHQLGHGRNIELLDPAKFWGVSATAALYRTSALRDVAIAGGLLFHPAFFAYYEDVELCARLEKAGYRFKLIRQPLATHEGSASASLLGRHSLFLRVRNRYWVHRLHRSLLRVDSLLLEDARRCLSLLRRFDFPAIWTTVRGVAAGIVSPVSEAGTVRMLLSKR